MREQRQRSAAATRNAPCWAARVAVALVALLDPAIAQQAPPPLQLAQASKADGIRITVPASISARSASQAPLPIRIASSDPLPKNCFVRVRGLPPAVSLSEGYAVAPGAWAVPLNALASLQMVVPAGVSGRVELSVSLVGEDGALLADAKATLLVELAAAPPPGPQAARPAAETPPRSSVGPSPPALSPADREIAEKFLARGEQEIEKGQIAVARNFFLRAAQMGLARGALLLAGTYDPRELARWRALGIQPNLEEARKWYQRARELGAPEAEERLARLGPG